MHHPRYEVLFMEQARAFLGGLNEKVRIKIIYGIDKARFVNDSTLFKKLRDDIWEFRTEYSGIQYRLLAFWDKDKSGESETLVVATHGFVKKTDKVADREIQRAVNLRTQYYLTHGQKKQNNDSSIHP